MPHDKPHIVIVDDDATTRTSLSAVLRESGYTVTTFGDGGTVLTALPELSADLFLLDVSLPDIDGLEICRRVKALPEGEDVPVVFLTADHDEATISACFEARGDDYCLKENRGQELLMRLSNQIKLREKRRGEREHIRQIEQRNQEITKLTTAVEQSRSSIVMTDTQGRIEYVNPAFSERTGYTYDEAIGANPSILKTDEHSQRYYEELWRTITSGRTWQGYFKNRTKQGTYYWERAVISPVKNDDGEITNYIAIKNDYTAEKRNRDELEKSREQYRLAVQGSHDGIWDWDLRTNALYLSPRWKAQLGYRDRELPNTYDTFATRIHPEDRDRVAERINQYLYGDDDQYDCEFRLRHRAGHYVWMRARGEALRDDAGQPYRMAGSHTDITREREHQAELETAHQQMKTVFDFVPGGIVVLDREKYIRQINRHALVFFSADSAADVVGKRCDNLCRDKQNCGMCRAAEAIERGKEINWEDSAGDTVEVEGRYYVVKSRPVFGDDGTVRMVINYYSDITELKQQENALRTSEAYYRALFDIMLDAVFIVKADSGDIVSANAAAGKLLRCDPVDLVGAHLSVIHPEGEREEHRRSFERLRGQDVTVEAVVERRDGERRQVVIHQRSFTTALGEKMTYGLLRDVTERKEMEGALRRSEERYRLLVENAGEPIVMVDAQGTILFLNQAAVSYENTTPAALLGKNIRDLFPPPLVEQLSSDIHLVLSSGEGFSHEVEVVFPTGGKRWFYSHLQPVETDEAEHGAVMIINTDITGMKHAEAALRESEEKFRLIFEKNPIPIFLTDDAGNYVDVNSASCDLFGYKREEFLRLTILDLAPVDRHEQERQLFAQLQSDEQVVTDADFLAKGGRVVRMHLHAVKLSDTRMLGMGLDITDLVRAKEAAEAANIAKSRFLSNMSHEIRTPLNAVLGYSELVEQLDVPETALEYISGIKSSGRVLLELMSDILDLSRLEAGETEVRDDDLSLRELVIELRDIYQLNAKEKGLILQTSVADTVPPRIRFDRPKLRQILLNLLSNAVKFTRAGEIGLTVEARSGGENTVLLDFCVYDTGIGIPETKKTHVFDLFQQVDMDLNRKYEGAGLGLALVAKLTNLLGGTVTVKSESARGSRFTVTFPKVRIVEGDDPTANGPAPPATDTEAGAAGTDSVSHEPLDPRARAEIRRRLETDFEPRWREVCRSHSFQALAAFGADLRQLGEEQGCAALKTYGQSIVDKADRFDITALEKELRRFPDLTERCAEEAPSRTESKNQEDTDE